MKKCFVLIFSVLLFTSSYSMANDLFFSLNPGWGSYQMIDLKNYFDDIKKSNAIGLVTDDFPGYFNIGADLLYEMTGSLNIGVAFIFNSTGGRFHYNDYSGYIDSKSVNYCIGLGPVFELKTSILDDRITVKYYSRFGLLLSSMELSHYMEINEEVIKDNKSTTEASSMFLEPGFKVLWNNDNVNFGIGMGYFLDFDEFYDGTEFRTQWDGIRLYAILETNISKLLQ